MDNKLMDIHTAINQTVYSSGLSLKEIAADLDMSPSELSRRCNVNDSISMTKQLERIVQLIRKTKNFSILDTMEEAVGREAKPIEKSPTQLIEDLKEVINELPVRLKEALEVMESKDD